MNTNKLTAPSTDLRYRPSEAMTISFAGGYLINKPMQYILESNGVYVKSVSKDEITLTKKKEEAHVFPDVVDLNNHQYWLVFEFNLTYNSQPLQHENRF